MEPKILSILENASDKILAAAIVDSFKEVERNYFLKSWKTAELDAGHFVEAVRRFLDLKLFGSYLPIGKSLPKFDAQAMQKYESAHSDESYRIHIPRVLLAIYGIRNKRGVGHLSKISPNHSDATLIIADVKWVLAELIRINSSYTADETTKIVDKIVERGVEGIWEEGDIVRILAEGLTLEEKIIFLLNNTKVSDDLGLMSIIEAKDEKYFKRKLRALHDKRIIEYKLGGECKLSPKGVQLAEKIILDKVNK